MTACAFTASSVREGTIGERPGVGGLALRGGFGIPVHHVALCGLELLGRKPESPRALDLGREQPRGLHRILPGDGGSGDKRLVASNHAGALRLCGQKRPNGAVRQLVEPHAEHAVDQLVLDQRVVRAHRGH
jgi:hypothetical protein